MSIRVLAPGWLTSVQDAGRSGHASLGIGVAGAMDPAALRLANALVGNVPDAACRLSSHRLAPLHRAGVSQV